MHGNNTRKLPVKLSLSQTSKIVMFLILSFMVFLSTNSENRKAEQVLLGGLAVVGGGRWQGKVWENEYDANSAYRCA
jgi:hypothetical protein